MTSLHFTFTRLIPILGFGFLTFYPASAQTSISGGGNSNPITTPGPADPPGPKLPSPKDANPLKEPPKPPEPKPEDDKGCEEDPEEPKNPDISKNPGSVDLSFSLEACPLEYSVAVGGMRLYLEKAEDNMGDPVFLNYNSVASAKISEQLTTDLPAGVTKRYVINQVSGTPLAFDFKSGEAVLKPSGNGAASNARAELRTATGTVTTDPAQATKLRQYRSAGGYMEFSLANGNNLKWAGPTGRSLDFPVDPATGTASMGLEVLRENGKIRQVKSPAGMLDVVVDSDGRGYRVVTYLPSEIGAKTGNLFALNPDAKPTKSVHIVHPLGTLKLVVTFINHAPDPTQDRIRTLTYTYNDTFDGGHEWDLMTEADGMTLKSTRHVIPDPDKAGMRRVIREVIDGAGKLLTRKEVVQQFEPAWNGWTSVQDIETPGGDVALRKVQSYRYGTNPANNDFRKLNWQMTENGSVYEFSYDAAGRMTERRHPWLDGADGKLIIEKYAYVPFGPGEVVLPGDGRPRTTTMEVGTVGGTNAVISKSYFAAYNDAANGGRHTVINEDAATPSSAFGNAGNRRKKQVFYAASTTVEAGRLMEATDENGLRTQFTYVARAGGGYTETMTGPLDASAFAKAGVTRRMTTQKDGFNRVLTTREAFYDGSDYVDFQEDLNNYSPQGQLMNVIRTDLKSNRQRTVASYQWRGDKMVGATAEDGSYKRTNSDGFDRQVSTSSGSIPACASPLGTATYPARPAIVRTTSGTMIADWNGSEWGDHTITVTAGSLTYSESLKVDASGKITEETDADGYVLRTSHRRSGLETIVTRPDGGTVITRYFVDGRMKERSGTGIVGEYYSYTANSAGGITTTVRFNSSNGPRFKSITSDLLGRTVIQETPGFGGTVTNTMFYVGGTDRVAKQISSAPQMPVTFYEYDTFATVSRQGETVRAGAVSLNPSSVNDRVQDGEMTMINDAKGLWQVRKQFNYPHEGAAAANRYLLSESRTKIAGFSGDEIQQTYSVDALGNWQRQVVEERIADRLRIQRATSNAFAGESVGVYHAGLLVEERRPSDNVSTRMNYDSLGRLVSTKQAHHNNSSLVVYASNGNQVISRSDASGASTSYSYHPQGVSGAGRVASVTFADSTVRRSAYDLRGNLTYEWGSAVAPMLKIYDGYNQLEYLSTYRSAVIADSATWPTTLGTPDVTRWFREESTGLVTRKQNPDERSTNYEYDVAGKITRRTSARGLITDYTYTVWGQPDITNYLDSTPDVNFDYNRLGQKTRESNGTATSDIQYSPVTLRPTLETISYDLDLNGTPELVRQLERTHDGLHATGFTLKDGTKLENHTAYGYDSFNRLSTVARADLASLSFSYSYVANSDLSHQVIGPAHTVTDTWGQDRDVLEVKANAAGSTTVSSHGYTVNSVRQRTNTSQTGTAFASVRSITWGYDPLGQLTSANSSIAGQDRAYQYDAVGNRKKSADSLVLPATDNYLTNNLNQYTSRSVNGSPVIAPAYDFDGNATDYPLPAAPFANSTLGWDAENRLIRATVNGTPTNYYYDALGRRIAKVSGTSSQLFVYQGWNVIADYSASTGGQPALQHTYLWGADVSGSLHAAGGVGGLLAVTTANSITHFPTYDGNGNVSEYLTAGGAVVAHFEYDPFGNTTVDTDVAGQFPYRFSTKPQDVETGFYYYGYRYYDALTGRWPSRDPMEERGGINFYGMVGNSAVGNFDYLGMFNFMENLQNQGAGAVAGIGAAFYHGYVQIPIDIATAAKDAVVGTVQAGIALTEAQYSFLGGEAYNLTHMTLDQYGQHLYEGARGLRDTLNGIEDKFRSQGWRDQQINDFMESLYRNLHDPDCLEKLLRKLTAEAGLAVITLGASEIAALKAANTTVRAETFFIENGVRRSLVSQNAGLSEIPATIFRPGSAPTTTTLRLDQLMSPKTTVPLDSRYLNIQPPIHSPIQVQPFGLPNQPPSIPLRNVILE